MSHNHQEEWEPTFLLRIGGTIVALIICVVIWTQLGKMGNTPSQPKKTDREVVDPSLITTLGNSDTTERDESFVKLIQASSTALKPHQEQLTSYLKGEEKDVRFYAAVLLGSLSSLTIEEKKELVPVLIEGFNKTKHKLKVVTVLSNLRSVAKPALPMLLEAFTNDDFNLRCEIADTVSHIDEQQGAPLLLEVVKDSRSSKEATQRAIRAMNALRVLGRDHKEADKLVDPLVNCLIESQSVFGVDCLAALCLLGTKAKQAVPILEAIRVQWIPMDKDPSQKVWVGFLWKDREIASHFFKEHHVEVKTFGHGEDLEVSFPEMLKVAIKVIGPMDPAQLRETLKDKNVAVRVGAAFALVKADPEHRKYAVPTLLKVPIESTTKFTRLHAIETLGSLGSDAKEAITVLTGLLGDQDVQIRKAALAAIDKIKPTQDP